MAQTSDGLTFIDALVFISPDNAAWTEVSGFGASIAVSEGDRVVAEQHTFEGDTPIILGGKRNSVKVTCRYVYTEEAADPFEILRAQYETEKGPIYLHYSPKDDFWFKTGLSVLVKPGYPGGEAKSGDVILSEFVLVCASLTKAAASD